FDDPAFGRTRGVRPFVEAHDHLVADLGRRFHARLSGVVDADLVDETRIVGLDVVAVAHATECTDDFGASAFDHLDDTSAGLVLASPRGPCAAASWPRVQLHEHRVAVKG